MRSDDGAAVSSCRLLQRLLPTTSEEMNGGEGCGQHSCALCSRRLPRLPATIALEKCVEDRVEVSGSRPASHRLAESLQASCPSAADAVRDAYCGCSRAKLAGPPLAVCGSRLGRSAHRGWSTSFLGWRPFLQSSYCIVRGLTEALNVSPARLARKCRESYRVTAPRTTLADCHSPVSPQSCAALHM